MNIQPVILESVHVRLEPMTFNHCDRLFEIGHYDEIWAPNGRVMKNLSDMKKYVDDAMQELADGKSVPFVTIDRQSGAIVGSTRFANIERTHRRVEIGWTWITPKFQRSYINTEAKYLMLRHAFEIWNVNRVELKTNVLNQKSRNAMLRIGAKEEGILRSHMVQENGTIRDTIYFSIIASEWPNVKNNFELNLLKNHVNKN